MLKRIFLGFFILFNLNINAQLKDTADYKRLSNNISLSISGDVSLLAINYEKHIFISPTLFLSGKFGFGFNTNFNISKSAPDYNYFTIPHHITGNLGRKTSFFEFGLGGTIFNGIIDQKYFLYPIIGYRYQALEKRNMSFRAWVYYPFVMKVDDLLLAPYGLSVGISF